MKRKNCWEVMKCGREENGRKSDEFGVCPAAQSDEKDDVNNGMYGGRYCWSFAGTFCEGTIQGSVAKKLNNCLACGFLKLVQEEEGESFILTVENKD